MGFSANQNFLDAKFGSSLMKKIKHSIQTFGIVILVDIIFAGMGMAVMMIAGII